MPAGEGSKRQYVFVCLVFSSQGMRDFRVHEGQSAGQSPLSTDRQRTHVQKASNETSHYLAGSLIEELSVTAGDSDVT